MGVRQEVGRDDADQERSQNRLAAIQRLSLNRQRNLNLHSIFVATIGAIVFLLAYHAIREVPVTVSRSSRRTVGGTGALDDAAMLAATGAARAAVHGARGLLPALS